jgi:hypothetical protein
LPLAELAAAEMKKGCGIALDQIYETLKASFAEMTALVDVVTE